MIEQTDLLPKEPRVLHCCLRIRPKAWTAPLRSKNGRMFSDHKYAEWKTTARTLAAIEARRVGCHYLQGAVTVDFEFKIFSKLHHESERHIQKPDRSNLLKAAEDVIKGVLIADDCQIDDGKTVKHWVNSVEQEGIYITLTF